MLAPVALLAVVLLAACASAASASAKPSYYLSLGDSLAVGDQPDASGHTRATDEGYADFLWRRLRVRRPSLRLVKLGCPGETVVSIIHGGVCPYFGGSQLADAEAFLAAHPGRVPLVTINIGDNDVESCVSHTRIDHACVARELSILRARLPAVVARLRAAGGPQMRIAGLGDYDQYLALWLHGTRGQRVARASVPVVLQLNAALDSLYRRAGAFAADAGIRFATADLDHRVRLPGHGLVPVAVGRVCRWTWACSPPPIGFNDHANRRGYRVLADALLNAVAGLD